MDNGPAREKKVAQRLQELGEDIGDPFEISTVRREVRVFLLCESFTWKTIDPFLFRITIL